MASECHALVFGSGSEGHTHGTCAFVELSAFDVLPGVHDEVAKVSGPLFGAVWKGRDLECQRDVCSWRRKPHDTRDDLVVPAVSDDDVKWTLAVSSVGVAMKVPQHGMQLLKRRAKCSLVKRLCWGSRLHGRFSLCLGV